MIGAEDPSGFIDLLWGFVRDYPGPVVFGLLVLAGVGLPMPEEPILLMAGAIGVEILGDSTSRHAKERILLEMTAVCSAGILVGDSLCFYLGRTLGRGILHRPWVARIATRPRRVRAERFFQRYGAWAIFIARFLAGVRLVMFFSAGMSRKVSYLKFLLMDFLGTLVSVPISVYIGFRVWEELRDWSVAEKRLGRFHLILLAAIVVGLLTWFLIHRAARKAEAAREGKARADRLRGGPS